MGRKAIRMQLLCLRKLLHPITLLTITIVYGFLLYILYMNRILVGPTERPQPNINMIIPKINNIEENAWKIKEINIGIYSRQGKHKNMEDRYVINKNIENTGISLFGIFDGHAGIAAVEFAKTMLVQNIFHKIVEASNVLKNHLDTGSSIIIANNECGNKNHFDLKYGFYINEQNKTYDGKCYIEDEQINFGKLLSDEILAADYVFSNYAKKMKDFSGSTILIAVTDETRLVAANVGDSKCVFGLNNWHPIQLTTDHKPNEINELYRIREAGGNIILDRGVWKVDNFTTTRTLGDIQKKPQKRIISNPDIFSRDLTIDKPKYLILASDGLWDYVTIEESGLYAVTFKNRSDFGAEELGHESYKRGSVDDITVLVVLFNDGE